MEVEQDVVCDGGVGGRGRTRVGQGLASQRRKKKELAGGFSKEKLSSGKRKWRLKGLSKSKREKVQICRREVMREDWGRRKGEGERAETS